MFLLRVRGVRRTFPVRCSSSFTNYVILDDNGKPLLNDNGGFIFNDNLPRSPILDDAGDFIMDDNNNLILQD